MLAGPQEGTALGNIMVQAKAVGIVNDIWEMRHIIANSVSLKQYRPQDTELWDKAFETYLDIKKKKH